MSPDTATSRHPSKSFCLVSNPPRLLNLGNHRCQCKGHDYCRELCLLRFVMCFPGSAMNWSGDGALTATTAPACWSAGMCFSLLYMCEKRDCISRDSRWSSGSLAKDRRVTTSPIWRLREPSRHPMAGSFPPIVPTYYGTYFSQINTFLSSITKFLEYCPGIVPPENSVSGRDGQFVGRDPGCPRMVIPRHMSGIRRRDEYRDEIPGFCGRDTKRDSSGMCWSGFTATKGHRTWQMMASTCHVSRHHSPRAHIIDHRYILGHRYLPTYDLLWL